MSNLQNRLKSKVVWVSIVSTVLLLFNQFGILDNLQLETLKNAADVILSVLVVFGILNNPKTPDKF
jgi:phi LC3 family holin